jgi:MFS family permease
VTKTPRGPDKPDGTARPIALGLAAVFMTYFVYGYFLQIMLAAMPRIAADLDGMHLYSWSISIPNLGQAFAMLVVGKLSDMYGRRALLIASLAVCLVGTLWSALSSTFVMLIVARTVLCVGQGGLAPLSFATLGDMYESAERSKWVGLLNIPAGIFAFVGPTLGGWFVDSLSWRYIFWCGVPLLGVCLALVFTGLSGGTRHVEHKIDTRGALLAALASSTLILAFSLAGTMYPWASPQVIGLLVASAVFWALFFRAEAVAAEPILDLKVLKNRSFVTVASACFVSAIGLIGLMIYYPLMMQGLQEVSATRSWQIMTPGNVMIGFLGVPAGFILARTKRYKWMYVAGYGIALAGTFSMIFFSAATPLAWGFAAVTLTGLGMGAIPTLNTLVVQHTAPKNLLGAATGALFFSVMIGQAVAPAVHGSAMNTKYNNTLRITLPEEVARLSDQATMTSLGNPRVLLSETAMAALREDLDRKSSNRRDLLDQTVSAIRSSMEAGLHTIFLISGAAMLLTFIIICTIPEKSLGSRVDDGEAG